VVGINTMIASDGSGGFLGIGFAIPINTVAEILPQLHKGKVVRGLIGVGLSILPITREDAQELGLPGSSGATISQVTSGGPADKAGLRVGDVIVEYNGKPVTNTSLVGMVTRTAPGTTVPVKIVRAKKLSTVSVKIEEFDAERQLAAQNEAEPSATATPTDTDLDMRIEPLTPDIVRQLEVPSGRGGAVVSEIDPSGVAARSGLRAGDVIISVNDVATTSVKEVHAALEKVPSGRLARLLIWRAGRESLVQVRKP